MENASKALLIAGSVLIVIALIALGVRIFNSNQGVITHVESTMSEAELNIFNNKFEKYAGKNKSYAEVMSLVNLIIAHNASNDIQVGITTGGIGNATLSNNAIKNMINGTDLEQDKTYNISFGYRRWKQAF